jgi:flagellar biosynthetic protein FliR
MFEEYLRHAPTFLFVMLRVSGLLLVAPMFGAGTVSFRIRLMLALAVSLMTASVSAPVPLTILNDGQELLAAACREAVLGLVLGASMVIVFSGLRAAGQLIGQMSGMSLAEVASPGAGAAGTGYGRVFELVGVAAFLITGGHRRVLTALLDTFQWMPPGQVGFTTGLVGTLHEVTSRSLEFAVRAAGPVLMALLLSALLMGVLQRMVPQINSMSIGFSMNVVAALALVAFTLGSVAWTFQNEVDVAVTSFVDSVGETHTPIP